MLCARVRYDKKVSSTAKLIYAEINSLTNKRGFCYASNSYFAKLYNVSKQSINNCLKNLEENGYINRHIYRRPGSKEILHRYITIFGNPLQIDFDRPLQDIFTDNTKPLNKKINNKTNIKASKKINSDNQNPNPRTV